MKAHQKEMFKPTKLQLHSQLSLKGTEKMIQEMKEHYKLELGKKLQN